MPKYSVKKIIHNGPILTKLCQPVFGIRFKKTQSNRRKLHSSCVSFLKPHILPNFLGCWFYPMLSTFSVMQGCTWCHARCWVIILNDVFIYDTSMPQLQSCESVLSDLTLISVSTEWTVGYMVNQTLVSDPTVQSPGLDLPYLLWSLLNHLFG